MQQYPLTPNKGFFSSLFDFSFSSYIAPKVVKVLFALAIAMTGITALIYIVIAFQINPFLGILVLCIIAPLTFLLSIIAWRVFLEFVLAFINVAENSNKIVEILSRNQPTQP